VYNVQLIVSKLVYDEGLTRVASFGLRQSYY